jgi:uncharacterized protein DUF4760
MNIDTLLIIAQLIGTLAVIIGIIIAIVQVMQLKKQRKELATIEFFNAWQSPEFTKAVNELQYLPDRVTSEELKVKSPEMENYAYLVSGFFESTGVLVSRQIISLDVVDDLIGGVILVTWKKLELWIQEWRSDKNPQAGEWFEWLKNEIETRSNLSQKISVQTKSLDIEKN